MKLVEQAIFTAYTRSCGADYRVVARSAGLCDADAEELAVWQPSRDALLDLSTDAESFNFHPLPSGAYCVSRTVPAGWEQSGARRTFSHCLIVPQATLVRFANNPFSLARTITDQGLWLSPEATVPQLEPLLLSAGAAPVDQMLLRELAFEAGPRSMAAVVQAARDAVCLGIAGAARPALLIAGLFSCLPAECRLDFSFSTGLKFSPRRPFRIVALADDPAEQSWAANYPNVCILDLADQSALGGMSLDGWSRLIEKSLATNQIDFLASQIARRRFDLSLEDLPALGLQLLEAFDAVEFSEGTLVGSLLSGDRDSPVVAPPSDSKRQAHAAHRQFEGFLRAASATLSASTSLPDLQSPEVLAKLERIDDLVYDAISGRADSLVQLRAEWPALLSELGELALTESREQYLRYALSVWKECADQGVIRDPARAVAAIDVLCLLFGSAS